MAIMFGFTLPDEELEEKNLFTIMIFVLLCVLVCSRLSFSMFCVWLIS